MPLHRRRLYVALGVVVALVAALLTPAVCYTIDERELAVVLQFGKPVAPRTEPGLYFKVPFIQEVRKLPKTLQLWGGGPMHVLPDVPTADGKKINVVPWAIWKITEPTNFVQTLREVPNAERRVSEFVRGAVRDAITQHDLAELVRSSNRELTHTFGVDPRTLGIDLDQISHAVPEPTPQVRLGREKILDQIKQEVVHRLSSDPTETSAATKQLSRGIEVVDLGIAKIDFVPTVRQAAFDRQIALMQSIASLYVNEGERAKQEIINRTGAEVQRIEGEGQQRATQTKGEVDAEIIRTYAEAISEAGEFYTFVRTLEAMKKALDSESRLILTTDSELFRLLKHGQSPPPDSDGNPGHLR